MFSLLVFFLVDLLKGERPKARSMQLAKAGKGQRRAKGKALAVKFPSDCCKLGRIILTRTIRPVPGMSAKINPLS